MQLTPRYPFRVLRGCVFKEIWTVYRSHYIDTVEYEIFNLLKKHTYFDTFSVMIGELLEQKKSLKFHENIYFNNAEAKCLQNLILSDLQRFTPFTN